MCTPGHGAVFIPYTFKLFIPAPAATYQPTYKIPRTFLETAEKREKLPEAVFHARAALTG